MPTITALVHLIADPSRDLDALPSADDYRHYFFDVQTGVAGFWLAQTGYQIQIIGDVQPWVRLPYSTTANTRSSLIAEYVNTFTSVWSGGLPLAQMHILVDATPLQPPDKDHSGPWPIGIDGGALAMFVVMSVGDSFSWVLHEVGHAAFNLQHSFDRLGRTQGGGQPGEYGNPYCVMSAKTFGNHAMDWSQPAPFSGDPRYLGYGPGLSVATRCKNNWARAQTVVVTANAQVFELSSGGDPAPARPQALLLAGSDGATYVVSYRTNTDWFDRMLNGPAVVLEQVAGGPAEIAHPGKSAATYLGELPLPVDVLNGPSTLRGSGFDVHVVNWSAPPSAAGFVTVSVSAQPRPVLVFGADDPDVVDSVVGEHGHASFAAGEVTCVAGEYNWARLDRRFTYTVRGLLDGQSVSYRWAVNGKPITAPSGVVVLPSVPCRRFPPVPMGSRVIDDVHLEYEIMPDGVQLRNAAPTEGSFEVSVSVQISSPWSTTFTRAVNVTFNGETLLMDKQYETDRIGCQIQKLDLIKHAQRRVILLPGDIWRRLPQDKLPQALAFARAMSRAPTVQSPAFTEPARALAKLIGHPDEGIPVKELLSSQ